MAPSAIAEKPQVPEFTGATADVEILPLGGRLHKAVRPQIEIPVRVKDLFNSALIEQHRMARGSKAADVAISVLVHVSIISAILIGSLYYTNTIDLKQFTATFLVAPPPPPPPPVAPVAVVKTVAPRRVFLSQGKLLAPKYIPEKVAEIKEAISDSDLNGVVGGVPGGVPGGQMGGVIGGVIGGVVNSAIAPPAKPKAPIRVGGRIKPPKPVFQPQPIYPIIARQARISGVVTIDAVLDEQGNVVDMKVLSGPPLLYPAALEALKHWKYEPTYLNETPITVQMIVNITFVLGTS